MSKLIIKAEYASLIAPFCSQEETRYYLNGFNVKPSPHGSGVLICATDGHTLGLFHDAGGEVECGDTANGDIWKLDNDTLKACRAKRDTKDRWLVILPQVAFKTENAGVVHSLAIVLADHSEGAEVIAREQIYLDLILHTAIIQPTGGTFPDYDRVVPEFPSKMRARIASTFSGEYLTKFAKVSKSVRHVAPLTIHSGDETSPSLVQTTRNDFIGVIMPIRATPWQNVPYWYTGPMADDKSNAEPEDNDHNAAKG